MSVKKGSKVSWNTPQGGTHGTAEERHTKEFTFDGQKFKASDDDPYWVVKSAKSGKKAAHQESSLEAE